MELLIGKENAKKVVDFFERASIYFPKSIGPAEQHAQIYAELRRILAEAGEIKGADVLLGMYLTLPEADIGGLHFNKHEVRAVFEKKADGWWHSRDILTEYLESDAVKDCFITGLSNADIGGYARDDIEISLPEESEEIKRYNGVAIWYWLKDRHPRTTSFFRNVYSFGSNNFYGAGEEGGCALRFRVKGADV